MSDSVSGERRSVQVAVIGGGPAGAAAAAWLAQEGIDVLVIEKERFPRFHIGESLLPNGNGVLKKIGVWEKVQAGGFVVKKGAQFTLPDRSETVRNVFAEGLVPGMEMTYQVERSRFDEILLNHAESCGAEVWQEAKMASAEYSGSQWDLRIERGGTCVEVSADWVVDASGRKGVMGRILGMSKTPLPYPGRLAVFNHFEGVRRDAGDQGGDIIIIRLKDAWFWMIPISSTATSVGVVLQKSSGRLTGESNEQLFLRKVEESPFLSAALSEATVQGEYRIESDYSFSYDVFGAKRTLLAGDAASFIDPVFSSGVYLALESGLLAAQILVKRFGKGDFGREEGIYKTYTNTMKRRVNRMREMVDAYYDNKSFEVFMTPNPRWSLPCAINSILAGCLLPPFAVRWRFWLFQKICKLHKKRGIAPAIDWEELSQKKRGR